MPVAKRNLRGLQDIRTLSGRAVEAALPHRAYMKLACLEMEKARRMVERKNAVRRLRTIAARLQAIEDEEAAIRRALGNAADAAGPATSGSATPSGPGRRKRREFKVKY